MKHPFPEISSQAEVEIGALNPVLRKLLREWVKRLVNGRVDHDKVREIDTVPHDPPWLIAEFTKHLFVVFRCLSVEERRSRGGADPPEFLVRCILAEERREAEVEKLMAESGVRREASREAETEEQEKEAEAVARAERETESEEAGNEGS